MNLSIVLFAWKLPARFLEASLWTLSHQTEQPLEIVFVNTSPDYDQSVAYQAECAKHPLVRCITAAQHSLNLSKALNIGIRGTQEAAQYVMTTSVEMLFSANLIENLAGAMTHDVIGETPRGDLPIGYDWGDISTAHDRWTEIVADAKPPAYPYAPGTVICVRRDWWMDVRGYDEVKTPYNYNDSDLLARAAMSGLKPAIVPWESSQVLHLGHPRSAEYNSITSQIPDGSDATIQRNTDKWGLP